MNATFFSESEHDTREFGRIIGQSLEPGTVTAIDGTLGAGKTRLAQGIASGLKIDSSEVASPTFTLCQLYEGTHRFAHFDAYRIGDDDEFLELGVDELIEEGTIVAIEWAERVEDCLPSDRLSVRILEMPGNSRRIELKADGERSRETLDKILLQMKG